MKFSYEWLSSYVDTSHTSVDDVVQSLVRSGTEVNSATSTLHNIYVGRVLTCEMVGGTNHPLALCCVDVGSLGTRTILSGAPNIAVGMLVPFAPLGTFMPVLGVTLEPKTFGHGKWESQGMICSERELGLSAEHEGILELHDGNPGDPVELFLTGDTILDLELTTNRTDCVSHEGIAREIVAAANVPHMQSPVEVRPEHLGAMDIADRCTVTIEDTDGCRRFMVAMVDGVKNGPSPPWLQRRLIAIGLRPMNLLIDITNYLAHDCGQPMHVFDANVVEQHAADGRSSLTIRSAVTSEHLVGLDDVDRELSIGDMVIASPTEPLSLAGVMGGKASGVTEQTTSVIVEAASWNPLRIRATVRRHGVRTDASALYEKGLSERLPAHALQKAVALITTYGGGTVVNGIIDAWPHEHAEHAPIVVNPERISAMLGYTVDTVRIIDVMERLEAKVTQCTRDGDGTSSLEITPPWFRLDLAIEEDIAEEVGRIIGYDTLPATIPGRRRAVPAIEHDWLGVDQSIRELFVGAGYNEARTSSFVQRDDLSHIPDVLGFCDPGAVLSPLVIANPLTDDGDVLRISLLPNLLRSLAINSNRGIKGPRLFEVGQVYWDGRRTEPVVGTVDDGEDETHAPLPSEPRMVAFATVVAPNTGDEAAAELNTLRSLISRMVDEFGAVPKARQLPAEETATTRHARAVAIAYEGVVCGWLGELTEEVVQAFGIRGRVVCGECWIDQILALDPGSTTYVAPPRFPAIEEDLAITVKRTTPAGTLQATIKDAGGARVAAVVLTDEYHGSILGDTLKGLTYHITYRDPTTTLTSEDLVPTRQAILAALDARHGARQR